MNKWALFLLLKTVRLTYSCKTLVLKVWSLYLKASASGSLGNLLEMQILGLYPNPLNQKLWGWSPATCSLPHPLSDSDTLRFELEHWSLRHGCLNLDCIGVVDGTSEITEAWALPPGFLSKVVCVLGFLKSP